MCSSDSYDPRFRVDEDSAESFPSVLCLVAPTLIKVRSAWTSFSQYCSAAATYFLAQTVSIKKCFLPSTHWQGLFTVCIQSYMQKNLATRFLERSTAIYISKPSNDHSLASSYRPINVSSFLCNTTERLLICCLVLHLESQILVVNIQRGFGLHRFAFDHMVNIEYHRQNAFLLRRQLMLSPLTCRRRMVQVGRVVSSETFTGGILGVDCQCFFFSSFGPVTSVSTSGMCYLCVILEQMKCYAEKF
jgi:hypothetical protein